MIDGLFPQQSLLSDRDQRERYFWILHEALEKRLNGIWEAGRWEDHRGYWFYQDWNQGGWFCEESGMGWVLAKGVRDRKGTLHRKEAWDKVILWSGYQRPWVESRLGEGSLLTFSTYTRRLALHLCPGS